MRLLPACSEGFRRLSIICAIVAFIVLFGWWSAEYSRSMNSRSQLCNDTYETQILNCTGEADIASCRAEAIKGQSVCSQLMSTPLKERVETWGLYAVGAIIGAYFAALAARTVGWVAQGFRLKL